MFTGIIEKTGKVIALEPVSAGTAEASLRLGIDSSGAADEPGFSNLTVGESIAVNGVCLTLTEAGARGELFFYASGETLDRTQLGDLRVGSLCNLERALKAGASLSGHLVQGHVDGLATLASIVPAGESHELCLTLAPALSRYCVEKGSIALDGISLTINRIDDSKHAISVMIIPHTWAHTNLASRQVGDRINVEVDVLAKYVERLCQPFLKR